MHKYLSVIQAKLGIKPSTLNRIAGNLYPPFVGAGIHLQNVSPEYTSIDVVLKRRWWNANYVGTQYGGSMFSMSDAWIMIMLMNQLKCVGPIEQTNVEYATGAGTSTGAGGRAQAIDTAQPLHAASSQAAHKYIVWDKQSSIRFKTPGTGEIHGRFVLEPGTVEAIRHAVHASPQGRAEPTFICHLVQKKAKDSAARPIRTQRPPGGSAQERAETALVFEGTAPLTADEEVVATVEKRLSVRHQHLSAAQQPRSTTHMNGP